MSGAGSETRSVAILAAGLLYACGALGAQDASGLVPRTALNVAATGRANGNAVTIVVPGNTPWTDTGIEVTAGEEILFAAQGKISLQKGNPESECGPDGYDIQTARQPLPGKNLGALIGKVVIAVIETVDEKTKIERRDEIAEVFFVGPGGRVEMPARGRLFLGINESVIGDNSGEFTVTIEPGWNERRSGGPISPCCFSAGSAP
jgi:hypothetical protein